MVVLLALTASLLIGFSDYIAAIGARRRPAVVVAFWMQLTNALLLPLAALALGWDRLHNGDLLGGLGAGCGYLLFLLGMAHGRMSVIAPLTAITTAVVPVVVDAATGVRLPSAAWLGIVLAIVSIPLLTHRPDDTHAATMPMLRQLALGVSGGALFSVFFIALGHTSEQSGTWPIAMAGISGTAATAVGCGAVGLSPARPSRMGIAAGLLGVATGVAIIRALQIGRASCRERV